MAVPASPFQPAASSAKPSSSAASSATALQVAAVDALERERADLGFELLGAAAQVAAEFRAELLVELGALDAAASDTARPSTATRRSADSAARAAATSACAAALLVEHDVQLDGVPVARARRCATSARAASSACAGSSSTSKRCE